MLVISAAVIAYTEKEYGVLSAILSDWARKNKVGIEIAYYPTSNDFSSCSMREFHIVFVDISMEGDENGLANARMFRKCGRVFPIVLLADNDSHLMESYEINAAYLVKPFRSEDIVHCMERIFAVASDANFTLKFGDATFCIPYDTILYIQGIGDEALIVMKEGSYKLCLHLEELGCALPGQFIWCAEQTIVNIKSVRQIKKRLLLWNDEQLEVNPEYRQSVVFAYINKAG